MFVADITRALIGLFQGIILLYMAISTPEFSGSSVSGGGAGELWARDCFIWLCLTRPGNYRNHEFDRLKSTLTVSRFSYLER